MQKVEAAAAKSAAAHSDSFQASAQSGELQPRCLRPVLQIVSKWATEAQCEEVAHSATVQMLCGVQSLQDESKAWDQRGSGFQSDRQSECPSLKLPQIGKCKSSAGSQRERRDCTTRLLTQPVARLCTSRTQGSSCSRPSALAPSPFACFGKSTLQTMHLIANGSTSIPLPRCSPWIRHCCGEEWRM